MSERLEGWYFNSTTYVKQFSVCYGVITPSKSAKFKWNGDLRVDNGKRIEVIASAFGNDLQKVARALEDEAALLSKERA